VGVRRPPVRPGQRYGLSRLVRHLHQHAGRGALRPVVKDGHRPPAQRVARVGDDDRLAVNPPQVRIPSITTASIRMRPGENPRRPPRRPSHPAQSRRPRVQRYRTGRTAPPSGADGRRCWIISESARRSLARLRTPRSRSPAPCEICPSRLSRRTEKPEVSVRDRWERPHKAFGHHPSPRDVRPGGRPAVDTRPRVQVSPRWVAARHPPLEGGKAIAYHSCGLVSSTVAACGRRPGPIARPRYRTSYAVRSSSRQAEHRLWWDQWR